MRTFVVVGEGHQSSAALRLEQSQRGQSPD
jgi:hypothetical protein